MIKNLLSHSVDHLILINLIILLFDWMQRSFNIKRI